MEEKNEMEEFSEKPIPLITESFDLDNEGIVFLQSLGDKNVSIVSIIGSAASGKSFLANQLVGKYKDGFSIGSIENREDCRTRGIWIWGKPIIKEDYYILILDAQGLKSDTEENLLFSQKIFTICTLISSVVIYNYKKDDEAEEDDKISEEVLSQSFELFSKMLLFLQKVKLEENEEIPEELNIISRKQIPKFFWVYRDCNISDYNIYNNYKDKYQNNNQCFKNLFQEKIKIMSLPCPMQKTEMTVNVYLEEEIDENNKKEESPFLSEYKNSINNLKKEIIDSCLPKDVKGLILNGNLFYGLLQEYSSSVSCGDSIFAESPLSNVIFSNLGETTDKISDTLKEELEKKNEECYDFIEKFKNTFELFDENAFKEYGETFLGKLLHSEFLTEEMSKILSSISDELLESGINSVLENYNEELTNLTKIDSEKKILKINNVNDIKQNLILLSQSITTTLDEKIFPKEKIFISSFSLIKEYIIKCICQKIKEYADSIDFYISHNLESVENSTKSNVIKLEEKISELNKKDNELTDMRIKLENIKREMNLMEKELGVKLNIQLEINKKLEESNKKALEEKDIILKEYVNKINSLEDKIKNYKEMKLKNDESKKLLEENIEYRFKLGQKERELNELKDKFGTLDNQEIINKVEKQSIKIDLKDEDLVKLKDIFKNISKTYKDYLETVKKLENNKDLIFYSKFIEESNSFIQKNNNNWNEELNKFKEEHFKSMIVNYSKEISILKAEKNKLEEELDILCKEYENKIKENIQLRETMNLTNNMLSQKEASIRSKDEIIRKNLKEIEIQENNLKEIEEKLYRSELRYAEYKSELNLKEDENDNLLALFEHICKGDKKFYQTYIKKMPEETKVKLENIVRNYKMMK